MDYLRLGMPKTHILLLELSPRGPVTDRSAPYAWPNEFTPGLKIMNARFQEFAIGDPLLHFVPCPLYSKYVVDGSIVPALLPDALHPSAAGMELMAQCLDLVIARYMSGTGDKTVV